MLYWQIAHLNHSFMCVSGSRLFFSDLFCFICLLLFLFFLFCENYSFSFFFSSHRFLLHFSSFLSPFIIDVSSFSFPFYLVKEPLIPLLKPFFSKSDFSYLFSLFSFIFPFFSFSLTSDRWCHPLLLPSLLPAIQNTLTFRNLTIAHSFSHLRRASSLQSPIIWR